MADLTARAIAELKAARTDEQRLRAARRLRDFVRVQSRTAGNQNLGSSSGASLSSDRVHQRLFELLSSNDNNDKLSGIFALYELIDEPSPDNETKTIRFANYLSVLLSNATDVRVLALGAKVLGHLARSGAMLTIESLLDDKIKDALKWLQPNGESIEHRRLAAVFVLRELADAAAVTGQHGPVHQRATDIFQSLWVGLTDSRREIREASAKALASCLAIIATKPKSRVNAAVYSNLYSSARDALMAGAAGAAAGTSSSTGGISGVFGFGSGSSALSAKTADAVHGALLTVGELLASPAAATFMNNRPLPAVPTSAQAGILGSAAALTPPQRFNETCEMVLKHKDSKNQLVRRTVLLLLPKLAHCSPHTFVTRGYAEVSLKHLLSCLPDSKATSSASVAANASMSKEQTSERAIAYLAIGRIALAIGVSLCGNALRPQLERIVTQLRHGLNAAAALAIEASRQARAATTAAARASAVRVARNTGAVEALACVAMLSRAVGAGLTEYAHELVDPMFRASMSGTLIGGTSTSGSGRDSVEMYARGLAGGQSGSGSSGAEGHVGGTGYGTADALSMALTEALSAIGDAIPALRPLLQERLLHELSLLLAGRPFVPPYAEPFADGLHAGNGSTSNGPFGYTVIDADQSRSESSWQAAQGFMVGQRDGGVRGPNTAYGLLPPSISGLAGRATSLAIAQGILATGMGSAGAGSGLGSSAASESGMPGNGNSNGAAAGEYSSANSNTTRSAGFTGLGSPYGLSSGISPGGVPFSHGWARSLAASAAGYGPSDAHGPTSGYTAGSTAHHSQHGGQGTGGLGSAGMQGAMGANIPAYGPHTGGQGLGPGSSGADAAWMSWSTGKPSSGALHGMYGPVSLARARGVPTETVCLALHTLGSFDFSGVPLLPFVREVVLLYIEDPDPTLRLEAALTCAKLTVRPSELAGELESADAEPLLAAALFDAEAELAADVAASGEGEEVDELSRARQVAGLDTIDDDEDAVIGVDVLGPVALLRATATHRARNSHTLAAHPPGSSGNAAGGAGVATLWGDARSVPDVNPVAATLSSSYDTRRRHRAFRSRYMRITRPPTHPLLVWGIDAVSMGGQAGSGLIYGRPRASASAGGGGGYSSFYAKPSVNAYGVPSPRAAWLPAGFDSGAGGDLSGSGQHSAGMGPGSGGGQQGSHPTLANPAALKEGYIYNRFRGSSTVDSGNLLGALTAVVGPGPTLALISQILQRLLVVSIADCDPVIRYEVLNALDGRFDTLLVEETSLKLLIQGLSDENYACREAVLGVLGRLVAHNPASILPSLRLTMTSLIAELQYADAYPDVSARDGQKNSGAIVASGMSFERSNGFGGFAGMGMGSALGMGGTNPLAMTASPAPSKFGTATGIRGRSSSVYGDNHANGIMGGSDWASAVVGYAGGTGTGAPYSSSSSGTSMTQLAYNDYRTHDIVLSAASEAGPLAGREHAARMLCLLVRASQRLVLPYLPLVLRALLPRAWGTAPGRLLGFTDASHPLPMNNSYIASMIRPEVLSTCVLACLGEISSVGAESLLPHMHVVMPLVVDGLTAAAHAMGIGPGPAAMGSTAAGASIEVMDSMDDLTGAAPESDFSGAGQGGGEGGASAGGPRGKKLLVGARGTSGVHLVLGASGAVSAVPPVRLAPGTNLMLFCTVAVRTIGLLVENTGQVVVPYMDHPHLMGLLLTLLAKAPTTSTSATLATASGGGSGGEDGGPAGSEGGRGGMRAGDVSQSGGGQGAGSAVGGGQGDPSAGPASSGAIDEMDTSVSADRLVVSAAEGGGGPGLPSSGGSGWNLRREVLRTLGIIGALDPYRYRMTLLAQAKRHTQAMQAIMQARLQAAVAAARATGRLLTTAGVSHLALTRGVRATDGNAMLLLGALGDRDTQDDMTVNIDGLPAAIAKIMQGGGAGGLVGGKQAGPGTGQAAGVQGGNALGRGGEILLLPNGQGAWTAVGGGTDASAPGAAGTGSAGGAGGGGTPWELMSALPPVIGLALGGGMAADPMEAALAGLAGEPGSSVGVNMDEVGMAVGLGVAGHAGVAAPGGMGFGGIGNNLDMMLGRNAGIGGAMAMDQLLGPGFGPLGFNAARLYGAAGMGGDGYPAVTGAGIMGGRGQGGGQAAYGGVDEAGADVGPVGGEAGSPGGDRMGLGAFGALVGLPASSLLPSMVPSPEEFYPSVALVALLDILGDEALALHQPAALAAVTAVLKSLGPRSVSYLPRVMGSLLTVLRQTSTVAGLGASTATGSSVVAGAGAGSAAGVGSAAGKDGGKGGRDGPISAGPGAGGEDALRLGAGDLDGASSTLSGTSGMVRESLRNALRETVLTQIAALLLYVRQGMRPWLPTVFSVVRELWPVSLGALLQVTEATAAAFGDASKPYLATLIPHFLSVLAHDGTRPVQSTPAVAESYMRDSAYDAVLSASVLVADSLGLQGGATVGADGSTVDPARAAADGSAGSAPGPRIERVNTRYVLHTLAVLAAGGRRAMLGGHRRLLDDHYPVLIPAIARLIDAGIGVPGAPAAVAAALSSASNTGGSAVGAAGADSSSVDGTSSALEAGGRGYSLPHFAPSNSSSLNGYGAVLPIVRKQSIDTIAIMAASGIDLSPYASRLIQPLARAIADPSVVYSPAEVRRAALDCLALLLIQMKEAYVPWIPTVRRACLMGSIAVLGSDAHHGPTSAGGTSTNASGAGNGGRDSTAAGGASSGLGATGPGAGTAWGNGGLSGSGYGAPSCLRHDTYDRLVLRLLGVGSGFGYGKAYPFDDAEGLGDAQNTLLYGYGPAPVLPTSPVDLAALLCDPGMCNADGTGSRLAAILNLVNAAPAGASLMLHRSTSGAGFDAMQYGGAGRRGTMGANAANGGVGVLDSSDLNVGALGVLGSDGANDVWGLGAGASKVATMATAMGIGNLYGAPRADEGRFGSMSALGGPMGSDPTGLVHPSEYNQPPKKLDINQEALKRAWDVSGRGSKEEWTAWLDRLALELLRESPIPALRACTPLAQVHPQLAKELFNAAFVAVWSELYDEYSDSLANAFDSVFNAKNAPQSVLRMLLAVVEFMERDDRAAQMPISPMQLGSLALRVGAFAKALHYREQEFVAASAAATGQTVAAAQAGAGSLLTASGGSSGSRMAAQSSISKIVADLISVNNALDQPEAAVGILKHAMQLASGVAHYGYRAAHIAGGSARPGDAADNAMDGQALDQAVGGRMAGLPGGMDDGPLANARAAKQAAMLAERSRSAVASVVQEGGYVGTRDSVPDNLGSLPGTSRRMASAGGAGSLGASVHGAGTSGQLGGSTGFSTGRGGGRGNAVLALGLDINEQWYEKLGRWDDALEAYERKQLEKPNSLDVVLGRMRCLKALGEWGRLEELARSAWPRLEGNTQGRALVAPLAARAAWALGRWGDMDVYLRYTDGGSLQGAFFRAVLATHALDFEGAARHIDRARRVLAAELSNIVSLGGEFDTYGRCYRRLVTVQQLAEIEESVTYLRLASAGNTAGASAYIAHVRNVWAVRMRGVARNVDVWHRLLSVRSLVTLAPDNLTEWLQFASLARRSGRQGMALRVLLGLGLGTDADAIKRAAAEANKPAYGVLAGLGNVTGNGSVATMGAAPLLLPMPPAGHSSGIQEIGSSSGMDSSASSSGITPTISQDPVLEASARVGSDSGAHPRVIYSYLKHLWHAGHREQALMQLLKLTAALDASAAARRSATSSHGVEGAAEVKPGIFGKHYLDPADENALRVQCHLRCGQWHEALLEPVVAGYAPLPVTGAAGFLSGADQPGVGQTAAGPASSAASTSAALGQSGATTPGGGSTTPTPGATAGLAPQGTTTPAAVHNISGRMPSEAYERLVSPVLTSFRIATHECEERGHGHYRAWHAWAIANFTVAEYHAENLRAEEAAKAAAKKEGKEVAAGAGGTPAAGGHTGAGGKGKQDKAASGGGSSGNVTATPTKGPKPASYGLSNLAGVEEELEEEEDYDGPGLGAHHAAGTTSAVNALTAALGAAAGAGRVGGGPFPTKAAITAHAVAAVKAFFRSIALGRTRLKAYILQDLLRLLTLMFKYAESPPVRLAVEAGLSTGAISTDAWLQVVPQLIARLHIPNSSVKKLLTSLMSRIGTSHPQSLIYPLTVAVKSSFKPRRDAAAGILGVLKRVHAQVCDEADVVSRELIRVAILWHEAWHAGLEDASRAYFGEGNIAAMLAILLPLHEGMSRPGPETAREIAFTQAYGRDLDTAYKNLKAYQNSGRVTDLTAAWELYYAVFRRINKSLPSITVLDLASCSPKLLMAHDLALSVPGTYTVGSPVVRIASVCPQIAVIASKQRPRRITLAGSDGRRYSYLLKGHEDLRQDERVMQLFGLVNTLLTNDGDTAKRDLAIRRYAVTPLSHAAGVVGWVPGCDTLHALVRDYRDAKKVLLNIEHRLMVQMAPPYDHCTVLQKVETFRYALDNTLGVDLARVLWLKSASAEAWLSRRTAYVRSLAVMSMVGYVLGLGDRHPSNLMLDRTSGKILHIDFGDCFETAVTRDKFPERVPFRLTRMLVAAMEVAGVEGAFRSVAEAVMRVLRANRDSVMALLEAFVHDPLINWRLLTNAPQVAQNANTTTAAQAPPAAPAAAVPDGKQGGHTSGGPGSSSDPGVEGPPSACAGTGGGGAALTQLPQPPPAASAGVSKLFEGAGLPADQASEVVKQGQRFHAEIEEGLLQTAVAEMGVQVEDKDTNTSTALARSIAVTYGTVRGAVRGGDRAAISMAMAAGGAHTEGGGAEGAGGVGGQGQGQGGQGQGQGGQQQHGQAQAGNAPAAADADSEALNERAVAVIRRIFAKLTGRDFGDGDRIGALMSLGIGLPPGSEATTGGGAGVGGIAGTAGMPGAGGLAALNLGLTFAGAGLAGGGVGGDRGTGGAGPAGTTAGGGGGATGSGLSGGMDVPSQVHRLILAAMSIENLAQAYVGWCPFW